MTNSGFEYKVTKQLETKHKFFPVAVDDFFQEPDKIREWALSLPKEKSEMGDWPGERTQPLHLIDSEFHSILLLKVLSSYFDLKYTNVSWEVCNASFQLITPYSEKKDSVKNMGWIHKDTGYQLAGLIYLTPNADLNSGTSLFNLKPEYEDNYLTYGKNAEKHSFYKDNKTNEKEYQNSLNEHNNKFYEKTRFQNLYNRCIIYDANEFHKANLLHAGDTDRLTLVFFIKNIKSGNDEKQTSRYPLNRVRDYENFDKQLSKRVEYLKSV